MAIPRPTILHVFKSSLNCLFSWEFVCLLKSTFSTPKMPYSSPVINTEFTRSAHMWNSDHVAQYSENAEASGPEDSRLIIGRSINFPRFITVSSSEPSL